ncbi:MAG TPA: hypothetical protein PLN31_06670 [Azoarcus taiwanensis]|uniref:hypothetical protein n=1 Tax=Azoarcus taiwanensis TaxID=666964 RepID=UPI001B7CE35E|nr:hypothetical protein [Azoarcus taiwanensis]HRQ57082.1 hypothetical protein [Azoarcus taiwanensis]
MIHNDPRFQHLFRAVRRDAAAKPTWVQKAGAVIVAIVFFSVVLMFSVVLFAAALTAGAVAWGYLWWKTRAVRKTMRDNPPGGLVIEGEVIREVDETAGPTPRTDTQTRDQS